MGTSYRVLDTDEFWTTCAESVQACIKEGCKEPEDELLDQFLKIFLTLHPSVGRA